jgi:hypothetical protein
MLIPIYDHSRVDKEDGVEGNKEANNIVEASFTAEEAISACRECCKLKDEAYKGYKERSSAENCRYDQRD